MISQIPVGGGAGTMEYSSAPGIRLNSTAEFGPRGVVPVTYTSAPPGGQTPDQWSSPKVAFVQDSPLP